MIFVFLYVTHVCVCVCVYVYVFYKFSSKNVFVIGKGKFYKRDNTKIYMLGKLDTDDANEKLRKLEISVSLRRMTLYFSCRVFV